eukprot:gene3589-7133_t
MPSWKTVGRQGVINFLDKRKKYYNSLPHKSLPYSLSPRCNNCPGRASVHFTSRTMLFSHADKVNEETSTESIRMDALSLLDCLTSTKDEDDPTYDVMKDIRRDNLLQSNDYQDLKLELRARGLRTSGDKLEMITRLLLHIIDPSINYNEMTGHETILKYVDAEDIASAKVTVVPVEERSKVIDSPPDAEDVIAVRKKSSLSKPSSSADSGSESDQTIMDGLARRELEFSPICVKRAMLNMDSISATGVIEEDIGVTIRAYVVGGRDVMRSWERTSSVVVVIPDETGWRSKANRILADEISFSNQAIAITTYGDKCSISLAGAGIGGGHCLEVASDLDQIQDYWKKTYGQNEPAALKRPAFVLEAVEPDMDYESLFDKNTTNIPEADLKDIELQLEAVLKDMDLLGKEEAERRLTSLFDEEDSSSDSSSSGDMGDQTENHSVPSEFSLKEYTEEEDAMAREEAVIPSIADFEMQLLLSSLPVNNAAAVASSLSPSSSGKGVKNLFSLSLEGLRAFRPQSVLAICPSRYDVHRVSSKLRTSTCFIFGDADTQPGSRKHDVSRMNRVLTRRSDQLRDFCLRVYEGRLGNFVHRPKDEADRMCAQDAIGIGSVWLDIYSRQWEDATEGIGEVKTESPSVFIPLSTLRGPLRGTGVAQYLHDDASMFKNDRLANDQ